MTNMHQNLITALQKMFEVVGKPFPEDLEYFKRLQWYQDNAWTEEQEKEYIKWLETFLLKNWKGITNYKPNKAMAKAWAMKFVYQYGWKTDVKTK